MHDLNMLMNPLMHYIHIRLSLPSVSESTDTASIVQNIAAKQRILSVVIIDVSEVCPFEESEVVLNKNSRRVL